jgi:hypothetical protein
LTVRNVISVLRDLIWPSIDPLTKEQANRQQERWSSEPEADRLLLIDLRRRDSKQIEGAFEQVSQLVKEEKERGDSVSSRLTSILGMISVSAAISLGVLTAVVRGGLSTIPRGLAILVACLAFYSIAQLCCSLLAALRGLSRRSSYSLTLSDVLPKKLESWGTYRVRHIDELLKVLKDQDSANNERVNNMAVAHVGLRNFLCAMLLESLLFCVALAAPARGAQAGEVRTEQEAAESSSSHPTALGGSSGAESHP